MSFRLMSLKPPYPHGRGGENEFNIVRSLEKNVCYE